MTIAEKAYIPLICALAKNGADFMQQSTMIITVICIPLSLCSSFKRQKTF
jgi:hypothetical protein